MTDDDALIARLRDRPINYGDIQEAADRLEALELALSAYAPHEHYDALLLRAENAKAENKALRRLLALAMSYTARWRMNPAHLEEIDAALKAQTSPQSPSPE